MRYRSGRPTWRPYLSSFCANFPSRYWLTSGWRLLLRWSGFLKESNNSRRWISLSFSCQTSIGTRLKDFSCFLIRFGLGHKLKGYWRLVCKWSINCLWYSWLINQSIVFQFAQVVANQEFNKMTLTNVATIMAPNLFLQPKSRKHLRVKENEVNMAKGS